MVHHQVRPQVLEQVDRQRIVELACNLADIVSITGEEKQVAEYLGSEFAQLGMQVEYQEVEEGRPNVIGTLKGTGGGATLMFCAHMDHFDNPQETVVEDDRVYGRGLVNMKAAFPCYIEAVAALQRAGVKLKGDIIISGLVENSTIKITDISGNLVYHTKSVGGQARWNGKTDSGRRVATGVYLVFCSNDDGSQTKVSKLLVIH